MKSLEKLLKEMASPEDLMKMEYVLSNKSIEEIWEGSINKRKLNSQLKKKNTRMSAVWTILMTCVELLNAKGLIDNREDTLFLLNKIEEFVNIAKKDYEEE